MKCEKKYRQYPLAKHAWKKVAPAYLTQHNASLLFQNTSVQEAFEYMNYMILSHGEKQVIGLANPKYCK